MDAVKEKESLGELVRTLVYAVILAVLFRSFAYEPFHIPSGSMKSNLLVGDYIFVSKFSYGYSRYSFPFSLPLFSGRVWADEPQRGDIAVFRKPTQPSIDFIKRVIGLPGDTVQVVDGEVYINETKVERERIEDFKEYNKEEEKYMAIARYRETLPEGRQHVVLDEFHFGIVDNTPVYEVPEGHYFVMGDNRDNSVDSRYLDQVGFVPFENLVGRAEIVAFSFAGGLSFRMDRFFTLLD